MKKYISKCFLSTLVVLILYYLNLIFIGLDFWDRNLRNYSSFIPIIGFSFLLFFSISLIQKKYYGVVGAIVSLFFLIYYGYVLIISLYFAHFEYQDEMIFSKDVIVEVYSDIHDDKMYFIKENRFLNIFSTEKCLFWYIPIKWDTGNIWKKESDVEFSISGFNNKYEIININNSSSGTNCSCYDNYDIESRFCLLDREFRFGMN